MADLQYRFNKNLSGLFGQDETSPRVLLAVSGGVDSMTMAEMASACPYIAKSAVAHCNFSLRGEESDGDEALVRKWAEEHSLPFYSIRFDTVGYAREKSLSVEMAARELRYAWFMDLLSKEGYDYVAVAHNMNDNAETLFLNLLRGTGIKGISGMKARSGRILRPMLIFSRHEIESFASAHSVQYRNDSTNFSSEYKRNRIRNEVFPILGKINPSFLKTLVSDMDYFSEVSALADHAVEDASRAAALPVADIGSPACVAAYSVTVLKNSRLPSYSLFAIASRYGFASAQCRDMEKVLYADDDGCPTGKYFLSPSHFALADRGRLLFYPFCKVPVSLGGGAVQDEIEAGAQDLSFRFFSREFSLKFLPVDSAELPFNAAGPRMERAGAGFSYAGVPDAGSAGAGHYGAPLSAVSLYADADKVQFPVKIRQWRPSDRMRPFGMKGWKKLSDIFSDAKIPLVEKHTLPVIEDASGAVVAIAGLKSSEDFRVTEKTRRVLVIVS